MKKLLEAETKRDDESRCVVFYICYRKMSALSDEICELSGENVRVVSVGRRGYWSCRGGWGVG